MDRWKDDVLYFCMMYDSLAFCNAGISKTLLDDNRIPEQRLNYLSNFFIVFK
jgi:hypothetical protein